MNQLRPTRRFIILRTANGRSRADTFCINSYAQPQACHVLRRNGFLPVFLVRVPVAYRKYNNVSYCSISTLQTLADYLLASAGGKGRPTAGTLENAGVHASKYLRVLLGVSKYMPTSEKSCIHSVRKSRQSTTV